MRQVLSRAARDRAQERAVLRDAEERAVERQECAVERAVAARAAQVASQRPAPPKEAALAPGGVEGRSGQSEDQGQGGHSGPALGQSGQSGEGGGGDRPTGPIPEVVSTTLKRPPHWNAPSPLEDKRLKHSRPSARTQNDGQGGVRSRRYGVRRSDHPKRGQSGLGHPVEDQRGDNQRSQWQSGPGGQSGSGDLWRGRSDAGSQTMVGQGVERATLTDTLSEAGNGNGNGNVGDGRTLTGTSTGSP